MLKALYTSITGMNANQNALSVTSNNIANAQTSGYKRQKAVFDDLLYNNSIGAKGNENYAGTNPTSIGNGVKLSGTTTDFNGGSITLTGGKMEAALEDKGFFMVGDKNGGNVEYTRKGGFGVSDNYDVVNGQGQYVLGYPVNPATGEIDLSGQPGPINIPVGQAVRGEESTTATIKGNITPANGATQELEVFDSKGQPVKIKVTFIQKTESVVVDGKTVEKALEGQYTYKIEQMDEKGVVAGGIKSGGEGNITFTNGVVNDGDKKKTFTFGDPEVPIELQFEKLTNHPTETKLTANDIDGSGSALLNDYSISDGGYVIGKYTDGSSRPIGQLAVATFANESGLMKMGNGNYTITPAAGDPSVGVSNKVKGQATEGSNVDLSVEFVDLMLYQRGFQGNTKVIKVADEILNDVVNLIR
ncbi:flagellar hook protein FlgE [Bacillus manliponensis]|uniref:flagellar hook protein FlgE n=1 Tax=Bacillus manliponensis TaxID=574376 RepID=UPI0035149A68